MSNEEKDKIKNLDFNDLWTYLWGNQVGIQYRGEEKTSREKYELLQNGISSKIQYNLETLLTNCEYNWEETEWGFPKGRKKIKEADIDCAIREFCEETQLYKDDILINKNVIPFQEIFFGTNNVLYKHVYYIAKIIKDDAKIHIDNSCMEQVREVRALKWFSYDEVLMRIKNHNVERIKIFKKAHSIISASL